MEQSPKLFILIDKRLSRSQQAVQACHAMAEFAKAYPEWEHRSLVLLGVDGSENLDAWMSRLEGMKRMAFKEPYYQNRTTAVACHGCDELVQELKLL